MDQHQEIKNWLEQYELGQLFHPSTIQQMSMVKLKPRDTLVNSGDLLQSLYIQVTGKLKVVNVMPNGRTLLLRFCQPISLIGDVELVNKEAAVVQVEAVSETKLIVVPHRILQENDMKHAPFLQYLLEQVCHKLNTISLSASMNVLTSVDRRFASYLLSITNHSEQLRFKRGELETTSLTEIAELLGTSYRHLNRVIKSFIERGIIEKQHSEIVIRDVDALKQLSDGHLYQ